MNEPINEPIADLLIERIGPLVLKLAALAAALVMGAPLALALAAPCLAALLSSVT